MKNIHVLPTDNYKEDYKLQNSDTVIQVVKLGQLIFDSSLKEFRINKNKSWAASCDTDVLVPHNIYITSDEEIKYGNYVFNEVSAEVYRITILGDLVNYEKKIILTTDQDLIKDGVQAIDDEFLEWFVKNPSCEYVEIENIYDKFLNGDKRSVSDFRNKYKIILPKEEPKQEFLKQKRMSGAKTVSRILEESKQETLEGKFQSWNELIKEVGSEEELLRILKLPHIAPLLREAMRSKCKNK